jgi:hypothetical protein
MTDGTVIKRCRVSRDALDDWRGGYGTTQSEHRQTFEEFASDFEEIAARKLDADPTPEITEITTND